MSRTLVLNATYEPLGVITDRRALILVLNHRATMLRGPGTKSAAANLAIARAIARVPKDWTRIAATRIVTTRRGVPAIQSRNSRRV